MPNIDKVLAVEAGEEFEGLAMEIFRRQSADCQPYSDYLAALEVDPLRVGRVAEIPFLPIEIFKTHRVYCEGSGGGGAGENGCESAPEAVFTSSGAVQSRHWVASLADYERVFRRGFELFYGPAEEWQITSLLPCYEERTGSSLIYMVDRLRGGGRKNAQKKMLFGVSYALLDLAEELTRKGEKLPAGTVVMETGGMKGRRAEMSKTALHDILTRAFGVETIHSEYGMTELMSQAYSAGGGIFASPPWMRVLVRDPGDPFDVRSAGRGGLNVIDLGNLHSCAFIETQDRGSVAADGRFTIDGRITGADIRGCNLLVQ